MQQICNKKMSPQSGRDRCYHGQQFAANAINCHIENPILPKRNIWILYLHTNTTILWNFELQFICLLTIKAIFVK